MWLLPGVLAFVRLQAKDFIKFCFCVIFNNNRVASIVEFKVDAIGCLYWRDCHTLVDEMLAYRFLNTWGNGFVTACAKRLYLLWHEIVNGSQCLGVKVNLFVHS